MILSEMNVGVVYATPSFIRSSDLNGSLLLF